jgi:thiol-disulfide isomerase/thioredoxin
MYILSFLRKNLGILISILILGTVYFSVDARTFLIRGLMRTGLYKADIKTDRKTMLENHSWSLPAGIVLKDVNGTNINLAGQKGKVLFINFWTTWCPPCRAEMPSINALHDKLKDNPNIRFYMVDADGRLLAAEKFMRKNHFALPVHSASSYIPPEIFPGNLPTTLVVSAEGKIVYHHIGLADYDHPDFLEFLTNLSK